MREAETYCILNGLVCCRGLGRIGEITTVVPVTHDRERKRHMRQDSGLADDPKKELQLF